MSTPTELNAFQTGADFISLNFSSSTYPQPNGNAEAGPSRPVRNARKSEKRTRPVDDGDPATTAVNGIIGEKKRKHEKTNGKGKATPVEKRAIGNANGDTGPKNLKEERRAAERLAPWADMVDWEGLNEEIVAFYRYISPTHHEFEVRLFVIELITRAVHKLWPDATITPFGSWQTQLYLPQGDIDLVVSNKRFSENLKGKMLAELARAMRQAYITDVVAIISKAKVPIIKFVTNEGKLNVDISLNQANGVSSGRIINQYLDILPGSRQLILVVKAFLSQRSMNEVYTGGLGSYAVICMVISFLQLHPKLRRSEIDPEKNLGTLLIEFLELYGRNFHYDEVGISIRRGGFYYNKVSRGWKRAAQPYLLSIEDPQDRDNDISVGSFGIRQVKGTLAGAYELLQGKLFERAAQISEETTVRFPRNVDAEESSILSGVMGVTKATVKQRRELQKLHDEGRLQRMLHIPTGVESSTYFAKHDIPTRPGLKHPADQDLAPSRPDIKRQRMNPGINAIIVEDHEITDGLDSSSAEEGEIVEVFPNDRGSYRSDRIGTVSEDDVEEHIMDLDDDEEEESRYALGSREGRGETERNGAGSGSGSSSGSDSEAKSDSNHLDSDSDSKPDSGSVIAIQQPEGAAAAKHANGKTPAQTRREFWAAKGRRAVTGRDADGSADRADYVDLA